ncbi:PfkB family carbohydrate kinase [Cohnella lupini]|uniref:Fructokinase n=1 Tax=Cohnella lupini TaxID=1294267 RepID=A0A3D9IYL1_9BACL|nr:PfkB family carbohydrate kinase [Cohnella lupini]RED66166.1 fructokinase [Cohnella lupini]
MSMDVICLGELLIDFVSTAKNVSLIHSPGFVKAPGGAPANVAVGVVKLGGSAGFIGKVGQDPFGHYLKQVLDQLNVDTSYLAFDEFARTTLSFVAQNPEGDRDCMFYRNPGADMQLTPADITEDYIRSGTIFHYGSISFGSPSSREATIRALEIARASGLYISYDPNLRMDLWKDHEVAKRDINAGFQYADLVKISEEEYEFITGCRSVEECGSYILGQGAKLVIVTMGKDGCYFTNGNASGYADGFPANVVETTGAGDAFVAAMLSQIGKLIRSGESKKIESESELRGMLRFANAAGSIATTGFGAIPSLPTLKEVEELLGL